MKAIYRVFRYEFGRNVRRRGYLLMTIGLPLIAIALFYGVQAIQKVQQSTPGSSISTPSQPSKILDNSPTVIGVVDQSGLLDTNANLGKLVRYPDIATANAALENGKLNSYYLIPADYVKSGKLEVWMARFGINNVDSSAARTVLTSALANKVGNPDPNVIQRLMEKAPEVVHHQVSETNEASRTAGEGASFILVYGFAIAFMFTTFLTSGLLMQSVVEERTNRIVEVLMSSMRPAELLAGKVLALGALGLLQMACWGAAVVYLIGRISILTPALAGLSVSPQQIGIVLAYFVLGYLMFAAVYAGIGALANSTREGPQMATFFTLPALAPVYLTVIFATQPNSALPVALSLFPVTAPIAMIMRVSITTVPLWQIILSLTLLLLTGIAFMWIAGRIFRVSVLLAGQTPKLRDLPKLIRDSG